MIGMENKTVWVARGENSEIIAITASDREAARAIVQTYYFDLDDEGMVEYDEEGRHCWGYTSVREAAEKCRLDVWIPDYSIEEYVVSRYPQPLT